MWIKREFEEHLKQISQETPIIVLTGSRQVGKSALLEKFLSEEGNLNSVVSFDLPRHAHTASANPEEFLESLKLPAVLDEIQYVPTIFRVIKHFVDERKNQSQSTMLYLTGSEKFALMENISESLAGRASILNLETLSLKELENWSGKKAEKTQLLSWMIQGGYPALHAQNISTQRFFSSLVATYIERDVKRIANIQNTRTFDAFLQMCALRTGQLMSMNNIASDLGTSQSTISRWINILVASGIIDLVLPWNVNPNKRLVKTPKIYFNDTGLCCFLIGIQTTEELARTQLLGHLFETMCYGQLKRSYTNKGLQPRISYFRTHDGAEIDFIVQKGLSYQAYECKYAENPQYKESNFKKFSEFSNPESLQRIILNSGRTCFFNQEKNMHIVSCVEAGRYLSIVE
jgi:uncharacterized protein